MTGCRDRAEYYAALLRRERQMRCPEAGRPCVAERLRALKPRSGEQGTNAGAARRWAKGRYPAWSLQLCGVDPAQGHAVRDPLLASRTTRSSTSRALRFAAGTIELGPFHAPLLLRARHVECLSEVGSTRTSALYESFTRHFTSHGLGHLGFVRRPGAGSGHHRRRPYSAAARTQYFGDTYGSHRTRGRMACRRCADRSARHACCCVCQRA